MKKSNAQIFIFFVILAYWLISTLTGIYFLGAPISVSIKIIVLPINLVIKSFANNEAIGLAIFLLFILTTLFTTTLVAYKKNRYKLTVSAVISYFIICSYLAVFCSLP